MHSGRTIDSQKMSENEFLEKKVLDSEFTLRADHPGGTIPALLNGEHVRGSGYRGTSDRLPLGIVAGIGNPGGLIFFNRNTFYVIS